MFAVKLANFLMFTVSEQNTAKCLEGSWTSSLYVISASPLNNFYGDILHLYNIAIAT